MHVDIAWEETASVRFIRGLFYLKEWVQLSWPRRARTFDKAAWMSGSIVLCNSLLITFLDGLTSVTLQYWGVHSLPSSSPLLNIFYKIVQKKIFEALPCKSTLLIAGLMWTCYVPGFPISLSARLSDNPECRIDLNSWQISDLEIINYFPSPARVSHVWQHTTLASLSVQNPPDDVLMWYCHIVTGTSFSLRGVRQCYNIMTGHRGIVQMTRTLAWICIYAALLMMVIHIPVNILKTSKMFLASSRSPRSADLRSSVRPVQTCLEQSIFIILAQIFKQSVRHKSALSEHSECTQRALREHSESNQWAPLIRVNTDGA